MVGGLVDEGGDGVLLYSGYGDSIILRLSNEYLFL